MDQMPLGDGIIVGQRLNIGLGDCGEKNKHWALNKRRACKICQKTNRIYYWALNDMRVHEKPCLQYDMKK